MLILMSATLFGFSPGTARYNYLNLRCQPQIGRAGIFCSGATSIAGIIDRLQH